MINKKNVKKIILVVAFFMSLGSFLFIWSFFLIVDSYPTTNLHIPESLAYCQYGKIEAYATTPYELLDADKIVIKQLLDSNGKPIVGFDIISSSFPLKRGQQAKKIIDYNCGSICKGSYTIILGTNTNRIALVVICD